MIDLWRLAFCLWILLVLAGCGNSGSGSSSFAGGSTSSGSTTSGFTNTGATSTTNTTTTTTTSVTTGQIRKFFLPTAPAGPFGVCLGPDGRVWFTRQNAGLVSAIDTSGTVQDFSGFGSHLSGICTGPDGNLWVVTGTTIARLTPTGTVTHFSKSGIASFGKICAGPDGNLWYTDPLALRVSRITPA